MRENKRFYARLALARRSDDECWEWDGSLTKGYCRSTLNGVHDYAHRNTYRYFTGPIAPGLEIDHLCRNPRCVNPKHLEAVTHQENQRRGNSPFAINSRKTVCVRGHPLEGANLYTKRGGRECMACRAIFNQKTCERRRREKASAHGSSGPANDGTAITLTA